jgi:hypothetical protein
MIIPEYGVSFWEGMGYLLGEILLMNAISIAWK